ncbi:alpha/beta-hydrolase [Sporormia fimetaria CBS 119925]|uniref:Pheromone-processing carboxypeptidase KEX1 n=1 Tax=Sporormia fimetaria CBS 119925 TaxID=1340428 RepID=A0A6A6V8Z0_9PLEO|nr:alpha/beta-hydrolase [Sporormia fimetaria CBS 119925]
MADRPHKTQADYFIHTLPGAPEPLLKMHAGHIEVDPEHNGNLFFWHYQNRHIANKQRTVLWLNGGPGCSSMDGALMEIGPYRVGKDGNLSYNNGSWDEFANLLFVDQPVGTGFSYVNTDSYLRELDEMAKQFIVFLEKWYALFPEYEHDDLYIAGESYAGQHIPYIAQAILKRNKENGKLPWNLKGLLIGNGWISPVDQYLSYLKYAYQEGLIKADSPAAKRIEQTQSKCVKLLNEGASDHVDTSECEAIMVQILEETKDRGADSMKQCVNMYDIRLRDDSSCGMNWPPDLTSVTPYLHRADVIQSLHINPDKKTGWQECNGAVSAHFRARNSKPSIQFLPELLKEVPITLFSGDRDLICNHLGTESFIESMEWNGGKGFELSPGVYAPSRDWTFEGEPAGTYQSARNLTYVLFYNSSHMVPFDYPRRSRDMLDRFMGVDISAIGGQPSDSRIDGEKGPLVSVGGHPNSTKAEEDKTKELQEAEWKAYYRSGEVALVVVIILAAGFGFFVWRDRRRRAGYKGVDGGDEGRESLIAGMGLDNFRRKDRSRDLEAAEFDERELDELHDDAKKPMNGHSNGKASEKTQTHEDDSRFSLGEASSDGEGSERNRRPGDQYKSDNIKNPFEERGVANYTAQEIATLQSRLNKQLGPEYVSHRQGAGGNKVAYLEGQKAILLANDVFGFNGWSSSLQQVQVDYVDETPQGRVSLGLSIIVRVTLKDGTYHEDIGYGMIENCKGKGAAFEKAKKEAATDGLKRALRSFGNILGNCLYDKEYVKKVVSMKVKPVKFDESRLHRHPDFAPPPVKKEEAPAIKQEGAVVRREGRVTPARAIQPADGMEIDDEFGGNDFDGVLFSEHGGEEEYTADAHSTSDETLANLSDPPRGRAPNEQAQRPPVANNAPAQNSMGRGQSGPTARPNDQASNQNQPQQQSRIEGPSKSGPVPQPRAPQTPIQQTAPRMEHQRPRAPTVDIHAPPKPGGPQQQNQLRPTPPTGQQGRPAPPNHSIPTRAPGGPNPPTGAGPQPTANPSAPSNHPIGFVTGRAAELLASDNGAPIKNLPPFNPQVESPVPKEKRTPGIDASRSTKITRESIGLPPPPPAAVPPPSSQQQSHSAVPPYGAAPPKQGFRPVAPASHRPPAPNFAHPNQDLHRRVGGPGTRGMGSPLVNRGGGGYKVPGPAGGQGLVQQGVKRPPLADVSNNPGQEGSESKKPRLEKEGVENAGVVKEG